MIIKDVHIKKFRAINDMHFDLGQKITAIVGHNATMKTTVLGILSQTFTLSRGHIMYGENTIDGYNFHSQLKEKFKLSEKDIPGEHLWKLSLYPNIYKNDFFEVHSTIRDSKTKIPRFWSTEGKSAGTGYPQIPAYYLSLKRVTPIGEEKKFNYTTELSKEEEEFLKIEYKDILETTNTTDYAIDSIASTNKHTASIHQNNHDALAISAGQDNLGKILIAVLSFKRLMDKYPKDYKGGLILIDEIESTFHPFAQNRLIKKLYKYSRDYKIQFIFTTHSPSVIKSAFFDKHNSKDAKLVYLKKVGDSIKGYNNQKVEDVIAELSGEVISKTKYIQKIDIYSEDIIARYYLSSLLSGFKGKFKLSTCTLGAEEYIELVRVGMDSIVNSLIILDGDKNNKKINNKLRNMKCKNIIFLPGYECPEKYFYSFLYELDDDDDFWDNELGGYDKNKCFGGYNTLQDRKADTEQYKKWFNSQKKYWGRAYIKLFRYWKIKQKKEYDIFINDFIEAYNRLALKNNIEKIER